MAFNLGAPKPTLSFGANTTTGTGSSSGSLFAGLSQKPATTPSLTVTPPTTKENPGSSLFLNLPQNKAPDSGPSLFGQSSSTNTASQPQQQQQQQQQPQQSTNLNTSTLSSGGPQIDIAHLRSTTKFDHLTPQLQQEILALDTAILNQIRQCTDVSDLLPAVTSAGSQIAPAIDFVSSKLDELETGLENDAEAVVALRDGDLRKDEGEAKCVFRTVDRLKVPRQYQVGNVDAGGAVLGGAFNGGLSGWWNQPQTFRGSSVRATGAGLSVQLVDEDLDDDKNSGPKNLVELFNARTKEMSETSAQHRRLLGEIEDFVGGLEEKVYNKERELNERLDNGVTGDGEYSVLQQEREHQMSLLRFVFGEVQRNLYDVAERVGGARDGVVELGFRR